MLSVKLAICDVFQEKKISDLLDFRNKKRVFATQNSIKSEHLLLDCNESVLILLSGSICKD
jgi:hypothetical protein